MTPSLEETVVACPEVEQVAETTEPKTDDKIRERHRAIVTRIGTEPLLMIEGVGEFRFAYRNIKKKPGEARPFIQVNDEVECRLTTADPPKAVSVRVIKKVDSKPANTFVHDPYSLEVQQPVPEIRIPPPQPMGATAVNSTIDLFDELCVDAINDAVDEVLLGEDMFASREQPCKAPLFVADDEYVPYTRMMNEDDYFSCRIRSTSAPPCY